MWKGPRGGGPCPLLMSSMGRGFRILAFGHFFLVLLTIALVSSAAAFDLHCGPLISTLPHAVISGISSIVITVFYLVTSFKALGTEVEWMIRTTTAISIALMDIAFSCWGFFLLERAAFKIFKAFKNELQIEPECLQTISIMFLVASFVILFVHVVISAICFAMSVRLMKYIRKELNEMKLID
ncbi:hypothetical protein MACJ_003714 [Theileria orientalis]|uniref:Uncharacterized protein n=1 Tax=Theileria orientalis TaxID=68886 RepID=A0A976SLL3_THEOR|nr:hypothetical protein MACJ_003714 [Theileria orientalis]